MSSKGRIVFWVLVTLGMMLSFGSTEMGFRDAFYFVCMLLPVALGTSFYFNYILIPRYLVKRKYFKFSLYLVYSIIISLWCQVLVIIASLVILANYNYGNMVPAAKSIQLLTVIIYLLVFIEAFINAFMNMSRIQQENLELKDYKQKRERGYIMVRSNREQVKVFLDKIVYIESFSDYLKIHMEDGSEMITRETISNMGSRLTDDFIRIHRSYLVSKPKIRSMHKDELVVDHYTLPVGRKYKPRLKF